MNVTDIEKHKTHTGEKKDFVIRMAEVPVNEIKGRIIRNPGYSNQKVSIHGWCWTDCVSQCRKPQFRQALIESIEREGVRNPIVVFALSEGCFISFGGSRVTAAREAGLTSIPAIVNDYCGRFDGNPEVTRENWHTFFTDVPQYIEFSEYGFDTHYFMERNRRGTTDPAGYAWMPEVAPWVKDEFPWITRKK